MHVPMLNEMVRHIDIVLVQGCLETSLIKLKAVIGIVYCQPLVAPCVPDKHLDLRLDPE